MCPEELSRLESLRSKSLFSFFRSQKQAVISENTLLNTVQRICGLMQFFALQIEQGVRVVAQLIRGV